MSVPDNLPPAEPSGIIRRRVGGLSSASALAPHSDVSTIAERPRQILQAPTPTQGSSVSPTAALWIQSRQSSSGKLLPPGEDRAITLSCIRLALRLIPLLWADFAALFWQRHPLRLVAFLVGRVVKGVLPAFKIWAASALLDLVQESFVNAAQHQQKPIDRGHVLRLAAISVLASAGNTVFNFLNSTNDTLVRQYLTHHVESLYLSAQLSLDIPTLSDTFVSALMYEAGCFAGFEPRQMRAGGGGPMGKMMGGKRKSRPSPFTTLSTFFSTLTTSVEVVSAAGLLVKTLRQAVHDDPEIWKSKGAGKPFPWSLMPSEPLLLILCAFLPAMLSIVGTFFTLSLPAAGGGGKITRSGKWKPKKTSSGKPGASTSITWQETLRDIQEVRDLGRNGAYKQEVVLFGLKDWVLGKWESLRERQMAEELKSMNEAGVWMLGFGVAEEMVQTGFYALLALRAFSTSISLGSIRLYQSTAESLLSSLRSLTNSLESSVQALFYMAAFFEMMRVTEKLNTVGRRGGVLKVSATMEEKEGLLDYEACRREGGMKIEARGLGFTYPGAEEAVLRDINLVIEPGTTLAIVGFNGGGKTTLVKVLMGLYDHTGSLLINDQPIERFSPNQLHARTTCCFQDHSKYSLTLRENVGIGNVPLMEDDEAVHAAIAKGGATSVEQKVGLEGKLNRTGVPDASLGGGEGADAPADEQAMEQAAMEQGHPGPGFNGSGPPGGRGPPPPGRGGFRGTSSGGGLFGATSSSRPRGPPPGPPPPEVMQMMLANDAGASRGFKERHSLSGGQWQKLALSRAFMRADQADLVVFDEPSAALDPRAEAELFDRIHALSGSNNTGRKTTTIYISHRFSTVRRADKIAVVDKTIVEFGTHEELLVKGGTYAEFFNLQKGQFD
ncbi:hypothetical protein QFC21_005370 [Naganishia friedmannii]|uniref:Uncharacterized protein n=1 Tax=Naganishia friedmannii TaxID=89922 RepID=A0ACC2VAA2_9TREE|nr:hypothetical protein QFC21_005370 [Naganishia friedmannii]